MKDIYNILIKDIQGQEIKIKLMPALIVYVFMTLLLLKFKNNNDLDMFMLGSLTYGIYDFTCYTIFSKWSLSASIVDMLWGGFLFTVVAKLHTTIKKIY